LSPEPFAAARRAQQLPFGAAHRIDDAAAERLKYVGGRNETHELIRLEHRQTANQLLSHDIGCLADRGLRLGTHDMRRHQILYAAILADIGAGSAAEIAFRDDSDKPRRVQDHQMANAMPAHPNPRLAR
jgi:non-ribosomal peptide synthetase component F